MTQLKNINTHTQPAVVSLVNWCALHYKCSLPRRINTKHCRCPNVSSCTFSAFLSSSPVPFLLYSHLMTFYIRLSMSCLGTFFPVSSLFFIPFLNSWRSRASYCLSPSFSLTSSIYTLPPPPLCIKFSLPPFSPHSFFFVLFSAVSLLPLPSSLTSVSLFLPPLCLLVLASARLL